MKAKFELNQRVKTPSGLTGQIIGMAEYQWGWDYRIKLDGDNRYFKNRYYHETQLKLENYKLK